MRLGAFLMPSHPPERSISQGQALDLEELERLDSFGFEEAWIGEHFTSQWEPCPAPDLLIAQALMRTKNIRLGSLGHLLPYHHPVELAHRVAYLDHLAQGRYALGVGISALPTDHQLFHLDTRGGRNRRMTFEALRIMTSLWRTGATNFDGEFWSTGETASAFDMLGYHLQPYQLPHPPIAIAAMTAGSENHRLAGAEGYLPVSLSVSPGPSQTAQALGCRGSRSKADWPIGRSSGLAHYPRCLRCTYRCGGPSMCHRGNDGALLAGVSSSALPRLRSRPFAQARPGDAGRSCDSRLPV